MTQKLKRGEKHTVNGHKIDTHELSSIQQINLILRSPFQFHAEVSETKFVVEIFGLKCFSSAVSPLVALLTH